MAEANTELKVDWTRLSKSGRRTVFGACVLVGERVYYISASTSFAYYSQKRRRWKRVKGFPRKDITGHTATLVDDSIIILGGTPEVFWPILPDAWRFDLTTMTFHLIATQSSPPGFKHHHSAVYSESNREIITFGGLEGTGGDPSNHTHAFNVDTHKWTRLEQKGTVPHPRTSHDAKIVGKRMYVYGGLMAAGAIEDITSACSLHIADLSDLCCVVWSKPAFGETSPVLVGYAALNALYGKILLVGKDWARNDLVMYSFEPSTSEWTLADEGMVDRELKPRSDDGEPAGIEVYDGILYFAGNGVFKAEVSHQESMFRVSFANS